MATWISGVVDMPAIPLPGAGIAGWISAGQYVLHGEFKALGMVRLFLKRTKPSNQPTNKKQKSLKLRNS